MDVKHYSYKILVSILLGFALQGCGGDDPRRSRRRATGRRHRRRARRQRRRRADRQRADRGSREGRARRYKTSSAANSPATTSRSRRRAKTTRCPSTRRAARTWSRTCRRISCCEARHSSRAVDDREPQSVHDVGARHGRADERRPDGRQHPDRARHRTAQFNSGLTTLAAGGVMDATINDSNLPEMVKSSETLAEIFRRVHSIRRASGRTSSVDESSEVLGADLTDGKLDGRGAARRPIRTRRRPRHSSARRCSSRR